MKFSTVLLFASAVVSALAAPAALCRIFRLKVTRPAIPRDLPVLSFWDEEPWLKNLGNYAFFGISGGKVVLACLADGGSRGRLIVNGLISTKDNALLIPVNPTSGIFNFALGGPAAAESRSTDWGIADGKLVYGSEDRFYAFPTKHGWQVRWVEKGAVSTSDSFPIRIAVEYL